jgi:hypothetical protein
MWPKQLGQNKRIINKKLLACISPMDNDAYNCSFDKLNIQF